MDYGRQNTGIGYIFTNKMSSSAQPCMRMHMLTALDLGLQVLDNVIQTRWKVLPKEQRQGLSE